MSIFSNPDENKKTPIIVKKAPIIIKKTPKDEEK
jgi:hypothetical protein